MSTDLVSRAQRDSFSAKSACPACSAIAALPRDKAWQQFPKSRVQTSVPLNAQIGFALHAHHPASRQ